MKEIILVTCLAAIASAIPHPERPQVAVPYIPKEFRRAAFPEDIRAQAENSNLNDGFAPNAINSNFVHIDPQQALQDLMEVVKIAQQAFKAHPAIKISPFPFNQANVEPIQIVNEVPSENYFSPDDKIHIAQLQVEDLQPKDGIAEDKNEMEKVQVVDAPIQEEQNEVIRVASIPIHNFENEIVPDVDQFWGVKFVETPNVVNGNEGFVAVPEPIAPSELESLRLNFNENPAPISLGDAKAPRPSYPTLYDDPMLR